jgi:hypothetical protein
LNGTPAARNSRWTVEAWSNAQTDMNDVVNGMMNDVARVPRRGSGPPLTTLTPRGTPARVRVDCA